MNAPPILRAIVGVLALCGALHAAQRPNVIIVMTDDQGYGEFSVHGNPFVQTPHIDRLASRSVRLTDFHAAPMCTATRGQLFTGLDALRNGAMNVSSGRTLLKAHLRTMADVFRAAGYRTGIFGKWHLGDNYPFRPEDRGFDETLWFPSSHINAVPDYWDNDYFDDVYIRNGKRERYSGYCTDVFFDEAIKWIGGGDDQEKPFFAYIPLNAAHWPFFVPQEYRDAVTRTAGQRLTELAGARPRGLDDLISFLAMGATIDDNMGKLERFLADRGLAENTIVVFLTDNGSTMGPAYYNAAMRGGKTTLWEGGHRVPCFISWPGGDIGQPRDIAELSHVQDLLPTLADLAGVKGVPAALDGVSLAGLLRGRRPSLDDRMLVINYSRMPHGDVDPPNSIPQREGAAVLWKRWRLLEGKALYNLDSDPAQEHDVAADHPDVVTKMRAHLDQWWADVQPGLNEPQRIVIGHPAENPMTITACEWYDVFVDQQRQIRAGTLRNGVWHLSVARAGRYTFTLRRWPTESGLKLNEGIPPTSVTDGQYVQGKAIPIASARIRIGGHESTAQPEADGQSVRFEADLSTGHVQLQTWFLDATGRAMLGAYYVTIERL